jgi:release factor glutamine methyltransferase
VALWAGVADTSVGDVWLHKDPRAPAPLVAAFQDAVHRRAAGAPLAYAVCRAAFRHLSLYVDERVLIPRPETEGLVERVLGWAAPRPGGRVVDVGVGGGGILYSLATEGRFEHLIGVDVSRDALAVAGVNGRRCVPGRVLPLVQADLVTTFPDHSFDAIVSNPPYVSPSEYQRLDPGVRDFEPRGALLSQDDGMRDIRRLCRLAASRLVPGGLLAVEIDARRGAEALEAACDAGLSDQRVEPDLFGRDRYLLAVAPKGTG